MSKSKLVINDLKTFSKKDLNTLFKYYHASDINELAKKMYRKGSIEPGETIFAAIYTNDINTVKKFLDSPGFDIESQDAHGRTLLLFSIENNTINISNLLIDRGANVNFTKNIGIDIGFTPLMYAMENYNSSLIKTLINKGADINVTYPSSNKTILMKAININNLELIKFLLDKGIKTINNKNNDGKTALMMTSNPEIIKLLLEYKADPNIRDNNGNTALILSKVAEIIKLLLEYKADPNIPNDKGETALMLSRNPETIKLLLDHKADPNIKDNGKRTPLMVAALIKNFEIVKLLVEAGADVNAVSNNKKSAIVIALSHEHMNNNQPNHYKIIKYLIEHGANVNNENGLNPLDTAEADRDIGAIAILLDTGADIKESSGELVFVVKIRDLKNLIKNNMQFLNKQETELYENSNIGKKCKKLPDVLAIQVVKDLEKCLKMIADMIKYKSVSKGFEKLEKKYESHPYFQPGTS